MPGCLLKRHWDFGIIQKNAYICITFEYLFNNMQNIQQRRKAILEIVSAKSIPSQEELLMELEKKGIEATQATLSRDLKALRISKVLGEGYAIQDSFTPKSVRSPIGDGILSVAFSGQMAVVKTHPGFASAIASLLDRHALPGVMGTIAGDDTVLIILKEDAVSEAILEAMTAFLPNIRTHLI